MADPDLLDELRSRLAHISWFMRLLCRPIARRANKEDEVTGRFFAQRFGCRRILDLAGLLACSIYVDPGVGCTASAPAPWHSPDRRGNAQNT
jgi:hypothetical protein